MNHKKARQSQDGRWNYTIRWSDGRIAPIGYCAGWHWDEDGTLLLPKALVDRETEKLQKFRGHFHKKGHKTAAEACECYRKYILDTQTTYENFDRARRCICVVDKCMEWTDSYAELAGGDYTFYLCEKHMNRRTVTELFQVNETWSE